MSGLPPQTLGEIWNLADTNRSGALLFPEFALAMYYCSQALKGQPVPSVLPEDVKRDVTKFVDVISFNIPEETSSNGNNTSTSNTTQQTAQQQPQQSFNAPGLQPSTTASLAPQATGFQQSLPTQATGFQQQQPLQSTQTTGYTSSIQPQLTGYTPTIQAQTTGYTPTVQAQTTGYTPTIQAQTTGYTPTIQAQTTGYSPASALQTTQSTGFQSNASAPAAGPIQPQTTGYTPLQSQLTGFVASSTTGSGPAVSNMPQTTTVSQPLQGQATGIVQTPLQTQATGFSQPLQTQATGFNQPLPTQATGIQPLQNQATGFVQPLQSQATGYPAPLQAMPTGKPGQWGFINNPSGGLPGLDKFHSRFMPQEGTQNFTSAGLEGNAKVEWAITKDEKRVYDKIFAEWDRDHKGTMGGETAIQVLSQSGLSQRDLEAIWTLSDPGNKGKLDRDEFAVAMHLIYRRLNNYPIPARLPPELIPPSSINFSDSVSQVKKFLRANNSKPDSSSGSGVSYMKDRSFTSNSTKNIKKDATVFKNDDSEMVYRSRARHKSSKNKDKSEPKSQDEERHRRNHMTLAELRKQVHEKKILLDAIDARDEEEYDNVVNIEDRDKREIETLKDRIVDIQKEIYKYPVSNASPSEGKKQLQHKLADLKKQIPTLIQNVKEVENEIVQFKLQLFKAKAEHENPGSTITGTGPNGTITDSDRRKAKNRALLKARMASLTGKPSSENVYDFEAFERDYNAELERLTREKETIETTMRDIEESSTQISREVEASLRGGSYDEETNPDREYNRFEEAIGVEDDVKDLILSLRRFKPATPAIAETPKAAPAFSSTRKYDFGSTPSSSVSSSRQVSTSDLPSAVSSPTIGHIASPQPVHRTPAERAAYIKAEAKRRMEERMAAMGIRRPGASSFSAKASPVESPRSTPEPTQLPTFASPSHSPAPVPTTPQAPVEVAPTPVAAPAAPFNSETYKEESSEDSSSSDDDDDYDDEQFKRMIQQRASAESHGRDSPAASPAAPAADSAPASSQSKESQMEQLKAQMEAMKREQLSLEAENDSDDSDASDDSLDEQIRQLEQQTQSHNPFLKAGDNNPFAKMAAQKQQQQQQEKKDDDA